MTMIPDLQGQSGPLEIPYCRRCGSRVEFRRQNPTVYNSHTGAPIIELRYDCPRRGFLPWGHARLYFHTGLGWYRVEG